jgi:hypothetical protein
MHINLLLIWKIIKNIINNIMAKVSNLLYINDIYHFIRLIYIIDKTIINNVIERYSIPNLPSDESEYILTYYHLYVTYKILEDILNLWIIPMFDNYFITIPIAYLIITTYTIPVC